jgi:hypothetical protein
MNNQLWLPGDDFERAKADKRSFTSDEAWRKVGRFTRVKLKITYRFHTNGVPIVLQAGKTGAVTNVVTQKGSPILIIQMNVGDCNKTFLQGCVCIRVKKVDLYKRLFEEI